MVRIGVGSILSFERRNLLQVILLEDQLATDCGEGRRRKTGLVVEVRVLRGRAVGVLHSDRLGQIFRCYHHGVANERSFRGVPLPIFAT